MKDDLGAARNNIPERLEILAGERVHDRHEVIGCHLHEAKACVIGALAHELGIEGNALRGGQIAGECLERARITDVLDGPL